MQNLSAADFYKATPYNLDTKNQIWLSQISDSHDNFCNCHCPFAHLLASIFPPGHQDRVLSINQILERDYKQCHSGGQEEENHGTVGGDTDREDIKREKYSEEGEDALDALFAAAAADAEDTR